MSGRSQPEADDLLPACIIGSISLSTAQTELCHKRKASLREPGIPAPFTFLYSDRIRCPAAQGLN